MTAIVITIRRRGHPTIRRIGLFRSTSDAIVETLDTMGEHPQGSISAKALKP